MKPITFLGDSLSNIRDFPEEARRETGLQLDRVQRGLPPENWKPMKTIGPGVKEIRIRNERGAFRTIYIIHKKNGVFVLHAFVKKSQRTLKHDIDIAKARLSKLGK